MKSLHIIYASTSGHTEYAMQVLEKHISKKDKSIKITMEQAENADEKSVKKGDVLLVACGSWNTGGIEGQLNPHMHVLVHKRLKDVDLKNKKVAVFACGDERYFYTCRAADYLEEFVEEHNGKLLEPTFRLINEPYGQEKKIEKWADTFLSVAKKS